MQNELLRAKQSYLSKSTTTYPTVSTERLIRVAVYDHSTGTEKGPKNLQKILTKKSGFEFKTVSQEEIRKSKLVDFDVLIVPGGSGSYQSKILKDEGRKIVREFVEGGGGYVGICAGSYLASSHYTWSLDLINCRVWDRAHWARGTGTVKLGFSPNGKSALNADASDESVFYGQGPLLVPGDDPNLPRYEVLADYRSEIVANGAVPGAMKGTHAIIRSSFGNGRVICFSPHPEKPGGPTGLITAGVRWAANPMSQKEGH